jgi:N-acetylmuramoyl-L-alanine amidase
MIVLDPGHGGRDPGAVAHGLREADVVLDICRAAAGILEQAGYQVRMTRMADVALGRTVAEDLFARARAAEGAEAFVSVHLNAAFSPGAQGTEVYVNRTGEVSDRAEASLASGILEMLTRHLGTRARGVKHAQFTVLRVHVPAVLVEVCFLTNQHDADLVRTAAQRAEIGERLAWAISNWWKERHRVR